MSIVVGITGGIATGKTTVAAMFRDLGAEVISADEVARDVLSPGSEVSKEVIKRFGEAIMGHDGVINRRKLAEIVFADPKALEDLNNITHPSIIKIIEDHIKDFRIRSGKCDVLVVEVPLLIECNMTWMVDKVVVVSAEQEAQLYRLTTRGLSISDARQRIAAQMPLEEKLPLADWVVDTDHGLELTRLQVKDVWEQMRANC